MGQDSKILVRQIRLYHKESKMLVTLTLKHDAAINRLLKRHHHRYPGFPRHMEVAD